MKLITLFALTLSLNAFAGEKCRSQVAKQLPQGTSLMANTVIVLNPGEDTMYMMGEIWNDLKEPLEYYGTSRSNGYYKEYVAVGASLKTCKVVRTIEIGDSLDY